MSNPRGWADATAARRAKRPMPDYFWSKVEMGAANLCWNWKAAKAKAGYGKFYFQKRHTHSHRVAWILTYGEIPKGLMVCHKCDNPSCCNPAHLFLGTHDENMRDCVNKGRRPKGTKHPRALLDEATVRRLRSLAAEIGLRPAARLLGINRSTALHAFNKTTWRSI